MTRTRTRARAATLGLIIPLALARPGLGRPDDPPAPKPSAAAEAARAIVPAPPAAIPDDPPPHEGALDDVPYTIEPPDILAVEALEALPGRPITGEHLVRPDGTIALGFYGDVHVRGLTIPQAKARILHHLREFLTDESLGLVRFRPDDVGPVGPLPPPGTERPVAEAIAPDDRPFEKPDVTPPGAIPRPAAPTAPEGAAEAAPGPSKAAAKATAKQRKRADRRKARAQAAGARRGEPVVTYAGMQDPASRPATPADDPKEPAAVAGRLIYVDPANSDRVLVDVASFNSKVYYVQGDVGTPGRLPVTGGETVLDALNYAGGLTSTAEKSDIRLHRPARGGKPAREYRIDLAAIQRGEPTANLQLFAGDRLVVGRNAVVQKTIEVDRAAAAMQSVFANYAQFNAATRSPNPNAPGPNNAWAPLPDWFQAIWDGVAQDPSALSDPERFRALTKQLFDRARPQ